MKKLILVMLVPFVCLSQPKDINYLVVKGKAEVQVPVEYIEIGLSVNSYGSSFKAANDSNRAIVLRVFDTLRRFSINDSDFQTMTNSASDQSFQKEPDRRCVVMYTGILYLRAPSLYDSLFQALTGIGNVGVAISAFRSNQHAYYRMLAYQKAVGAARREAEMLLHGSHQKLGKIIKLIQDNRDLFTQYDDLEKMIQEGSRTSSLEVTVAPSRGGIPVSTTFRKKFYTEVAEVTVIFELK